MTSGFQKVLLSIGIISLIHCAYSAAQHRLYLRLTGQDFVNLPSDILVQTLLSLVVVCYAASAIAGEFQPIRTDLQLRTKTWDTLGNCPSFYSFEHRAKALSPYFTEMHFRE